MNDKYKRLIVLASLFIIVIIFVYLNRDKDSDNSEVILNCVSCKYYNYNDFVIKNYPELLNLDKKNISNITISYYKLLEKKCQITLSYTVNEHGKLKRFYGSVVPDRILNWKDSENISIVFIHKKLIVYSDEQFRNNNADYLWGLISQSYKKTLY